MPVTNFDTVNGRIISEYTGSVQLDYITDALGSVTGVCDQTGALVGSARYKPYGSTLSQSGTEASVSWVGSKGYRPTGLAHSEFYIRRRHDSDLDGRWTTVDPLWPDMGAYVYADSRPTVSTDPSGLQVAPRPRRRNYPNPGPPPPFPIQCGEPWNSYIAAYCNNCYYGTGSDSVCRLTCSNYAGQYYNACNKRKKYPSPYPITGFQPVPGGGVIVPIRSGAPSTPVITSWQNLCLPPTPQNCLDVAGGSLDGLSPNLGACLDCCAQAGASTSGCYALVYAWSIFHLGDGDKEG